MLPETYASICWLKYKKSCDIVCTEVGWDYLMDACGVVLKNDGTVDKVIEIEVKTNIADIKRDFQNKQRKHEYYAKGIKCPNYMYFVVTEDIKDFAIEYINEQNPSYGIMVYKPRLIRPDAYPWGVANSLVSVSKCKRLTKEKPNVVGLWRIIRRMQNEYFMQRHLIENNVGSINETIRYMAKEMESRLDAR